MKNRIKIIIIIFVSLIVTLAFYFVSLKFEINPVRFDEPTLQTKPTDVLPPLIITFDKAEHKKKIDAISNIDDNEFYWCGEIIPIQQEICRVAYADYLENSLDNLLQLYPDKSFFRILRWACLHDEIEISKRHVPYLNKIFSETLSFTIESKWDIEKVDTLMLLSARYNNVFNNLTKTNKDFIMALSFNVWESLNEYKLNYCKCIQQNYHEQIAWFVFDVLKNNRSEYLENLNFDVINDMIEFIFEYYDDEYKNEIISLFEYSQKHLTSEEFQIDHYYTVHRYLEGQLERSYDNDDIFCEYFLTHPEWYIYDTVLDDEDEIPSLSEILTWKKYVFLRNLWNKVKNDYKTVGLWKRILKYIYNFNKYPNFEYRRHDDFYIAVVTLNVIDKIAKLKSPKEIYDEIEKSFSYIEICTFIDPKTDYLVHDGRFLGRFLPIDMQRDRLIYKWKYGELGYGSPTFPTECFIAWDEHKSEFPDYNKLRTQYIEFMKKNTK